MYRKIFLCLIILASGIQTANCQYTGSSAHNFIFEKIIVDGHKFGLIDLESLPDRAEGHEWSMIELIEVTIGLKNVSYVYLGDRRARIFCCLKDGLLAKAIINVDSYSQGFSLRDSDKSIGYLSGCPIINGGGQKITSAMLNQAAERTTMEFGDKIIVREKEYSSGVSNTTYLVTSAVAILFVIFLL